MTSNLTLSDGATVLVTGARSFRRQTVTTLSACLSRPGRPEFGAEEYERALSNNGTAGAGERLDDVH